MTVLKHPSELLDKIQVEIIRQQAGEAEKAGQLTVTQLELAYRNNWFNLFVPHEYGGLNLSLPQALQLEEALAWVDGSFGWTVTLCSGANWFIGYLPRSTREFIFEEPKVCLAGSGKPGGTAVWDGEKYVVNGEWNYATGAPHATAFTANCFVVENGKRSKNDEGSDLIRSFVFLKNEVSLNYNWNAMGMVATASIGFSVEDLSIPKDRCFIIDPAYTQLQGAVYKFPFQQFAEATLVVNVSGMAMRFIELSKELITAEIMCGFEGKLLHLKEKRELFYNTIDQAWCDTIQLSDISQVSVRCQELFQACLNCVSDLYPYCGLQAANPDTEINRIWRNIFTVIHHPIFRGTS